MNILFLLKTFEIGGVEIVTMCLANEFISRGHNVSIFAFGQAKNSIVDKLNPRVKTHIVPALEYSTRNIQTMREILVTENVQIVVNQWGLPFTLLRVARKAAEGMNVKFISVYHNTPDMNGRLQIVERELLGGKNVIKKIVLHVKRYVVKKMTASGMRYNYKNSDCFMVLSPSFVEKFKSFTGIKNPIKLKVQTNPITIEVSGFEFNPLKKHKEIIYIGRVDYNQKRVYRVIDTWALLEKEFPDWRLTIVGDGVEKENLQRRANDLGLEKLSFEGFQNPLPYYTRASVLMLTSEYEGFPLVLAEAMSFGVVPVVYGSYSAVYDIISDDKDGVILSYNKDGYNAKEAARRIRQLMSDETYRMDLAKAAIETSKRYSIETIAASWEKIFSEL